MGVILSISEKEYFKYFNWWWKSDSFSFDLNCYSLTHLIAKTLTNWNPLGKLISVSTLLSWSLLLVKRVLEMVGEKLRQFWSVFLWSWALSSWIKLQVKEAAGIRDHRIGKGYEDDLIRPLIYNNSLSTKSMPLANLYLWVSIPNHEIIHSYNLSSYF